MLLKFDFTYISDNDFFEFLLRYYAQNLAYQLIRNENTIIFILKASDKELEAFCQSLNQFPHSVFLRSFDVEAVEDLNFKADSLKDLQNFIKRDFLSAKNSQFYLEKKEFCLNEWGVFVDDELSFNGLDFISIKQENFKAELKKSLDTLKNGGSIFLQNTKGVYEFKLFNDDFELDFLMPSDIKAINSAFVCNDENLKLLASLEKPLLKLRFSALFRKNHPVKTNEFHIKLAHNLFLFALGQALFEENFKFLAVKKIQKKEDDFELFELEQQLVNVRGLDFINHKAKALILSKEDKNYARISYALSFVKENSLFIDLSKDYEDTLLLNKELKLLDLVLPKNAEQMYADICADAVGQRLYKNFSLQFKLLEGEFELDKNFFSLLGLVGRILNLADDTKKAALKLLELSDSSKMPRGVKIDYRFKQNGKDFDYTRTLRSVMSFLLAGVDVENIAYGAVESLAFFLRDFYDEFREKQGIETAVLSGLLFEHKSLLKNSLKHLKNSQLSKAPLVV